ncbi:tyrosine-protein phosphatase [Terriglobus tenax]|uniref:tyrosine-protein phosphatase n=1 Tax=Terriglobus tenax TaxID=1111115 RepID=UPI0021E0A169|nr:CpsB/CapC family capsule biosynthesis tyrosine phosphatase [Terriglobus tenax]
MIDLHHHLLYGLDDGARTLEDSLNMARMAMQDGITHIVCTPHANHRYPFNPEINTARLKEIEQELERSGHGGKMTFGLGCDFHMTFDNIEDARQNPTKYSINGNGYLLVELPDEGIPVGLTETFYQLQIAGLTPILTHPERNATLQRNPDRMKNWIRGGMLVQVTAGSVIGRFGRIAQHMANRLLADNWVHVIATDAHNTTSRPPAMQQAGTVIAEMYGAETARRLCIDNPGRIFYGKPLGEQPEPLGIYSELQPKKSWLDKLLRR